MKFKLMKNLYLKKNDEKKDKIDYEEKEPLINKINVDKKLSEIDITDGSILSRNKYKNKIRIKLNI